jgi:hypothetical protein
LTEIHPECDTFARQALPSKFEIPFRAWYIRIGKKHPTILHQQKGPAMALNRLIKEQIHEVVKEWVHRGKMFTAFEVSLAVKDRGARERHRNMRDTVHEVIFEHGGTANYTRTLMDVGAPEQAWVYHPMSSNPYAYQPLDRSGMDPLPADMPTVVPTGVRNPAPLVWGSVHNASVPAGAHGTDQRGRLCIPGAFLTTIGAGANERIKVQCEPANEQVILTRLTDRDRTTPDATYTVEADGNVRITQTTLDKANIAGLQCYHIEGDEVVVTIRKFA